MPGIAQILGSIALLHCHQLLTALIPRLPTKLPTDFVSASNISSGMPGSSHDVSPWQLQFQHGGREPASAFERAAEIIGIVNPQVVRNCIIAVVLSLYQLVVQVYAILFKVCKACAVETIGPGQPVAGQPVAHVADCGHHHSAVRNCPAPVNGCGVVTGKRMPDFSPGRP